MKNFFLGKLLLKYQSYALIAGCAIFLISFIASFIFSPKCLPYNPNYTYEQISGCNTPFCDVLKKILVLRKDNFAIFELSNLIFVSNLKATLNEITAYRYFGFAPVINVFQTASTFGYHAKCNFDTWFLRLLFPSGWVELIAILLFFSLFYSVIISVILLLLKKNSDIKIIIKKISLQIGIIILLYFIASILESISYLYRIGHFKF